ncbi:MAG TPA: alginate export family protein [Thermohalobaculum sp.]|nr:alginate export family protein [Thermohalobaculum sp.]
MNAAMRNAALRALCRRERRRRRRRLLRWTIAVAVLSGAANAGHLLVLNNGDRPLIEFASDKPVAANHHLTDSLSFGAQIEAETQAEFNFDLDDSENGDQATLDPKLQFALAYEPNARIRVLAEFELLRRFFLESFDRRDDDLKIELKQAYVVLRNIVDGITLTVGRQYLGDKREWLLDEEIDGVQLTMRHGGVALELGYVREGLFRRNLLEPEYKKRPDYLIGRAFGAIGDDSQVSAFAIYQNGHEGKTDEDLLFLGAQSYGELGNHVDFWADGAIVIGEARGRDVRGFGFDVGVTKTFKDLPMRPRLTASVAFGSGDDGDGTDTGFRQTGLHGNSDRLGGVTSLHYYGEVLDPDLSNLGILTLGAGFNPTKRSSVDLVYHHYVQHRADDDLRHAAIDRDPSGERRDIGDEFDLVIGLKEMDHLAIEMVGGVFLPGAAFDKRDPAFFAGMTVQMKF